MSAIAFDRFYTPEPADVPRESRWPWVLVATGLAIVIAGAVVFSSGAPDHRGGSRTPQQIQDSSALR